MIKYPILVFGFTSRSSSSYKMFQTQLFRHRLVKDFFLNDIKHYSELQYVADTHLSCNNLKLPAALEIVNMIFIFC